MAFLVFEWIVGYGQLPSSVVGSVSLRCEARVAGHDQHSATTVGAQVHTRDE